MADVVFGQVHIIPWESSEMRRGCFLVFLEFYFMRWEGDTKFSCVFIEDRLGIG